MKVAFRLIAPVIIACAVAPGARAASDRLVLALTQAPDAPPPAHQAQPHKQ